MTRTRAIRLPDWAGKPVETERGGWPVAESFEPPEGDCKLGLTDLSHRPKAVLQGPVVAELGLSQPGQAIWNGQALLGCLKPGQAIIFDLTGPVEPEFTDIHYTDMTEGWVLLGIWGAQAAEVVQRLVTVDVERPDIKGPVYFATGSHGIRVQLINLRGQAPGFLLACDRSQGQNLFDACIRAGRQFDLKITGVKAFYDYFGKRVTLPGADSTHRP
jgi:hypothetical protein